MMQHNNIYDISNNINGNSTNDNNNDDNNNTCIHTYINDDNEHNDDNNDNGCVLVLSFERFVVDMRSLLGPFKG